MEKTALGSIRYQASSSLMEDYRLGSEITAQTQIAQLVNTAGESELFYSGIDGQGGAVIYNVYPDSSSDTGWSVNSISPNFLPGQICGGVSNNLLTVFSVGPDMSNPDIHYVERDSSGNWGAWTSVDPSSVFDNLTPPVYVRNITAEVMRDGTLGLAAVLNDSTGQLTLWRVDWQATLGGWKNLGTVDSPFLDICSTLAWGEGVLAAQMNAAVPPAMDLIFFSLDGTTTATVASQQYFRFADSALQTPTSSGDRYSGIFLYNDGVSAGNRNVSFIDCGVVSPISSPINTTLICEQIVAVNAGANPITFMALDIHMKLNVIRQQQAGGAWIPAFELGETVSSITAGLDGNGAPLVFAVDPRGSNLYSMLEQPDPAGGGWTKQQIEAQVQTVEKIEVYGTSFSLMDGGGNLLPNTALSLTSPETTVISWKGDTFVIGETASASLTTDANGQVTLYAPTGSIDAAKLIFSAPGLMESGDAIVVDADDGARDRLKNLTVDETTSLLPAQFQPDAAHVQQAVTTAMSFSPAREDMRKGRGARFVPAAMATPNYHRPIDPASSRVQHWRFSVVNGRATFAELSETEAHALMDELRAGAILNPNGLDGFFDFLGDIVDAVENAVETAFDYVVSAAEAVISAVINGIKYVFDGVIDTVEKAFQVAASILASVQVFFEQLFDFLAWLLSGARQDIWNTKKVFEGVINQSVTSLTALCQQGQSAAPGFFAGLKQSVAANFDAAIADLGNDNFNYDSDAFRLALAGGVQPELSPGDIAQFILDSAVKANWLFDKIFSALGGPSFDTSLPQSVLTAFTNFSTTLSSSISQEIQDEITAVSNYLESIASNPGDFMNATIGLVLTTAKNLVLAVLDVLDALTQAFFSLVIAFLQAAQQGIFDQPINGFFLGALYDMLNPEDSEDLTVTRLIAIIGAFPATIIYRIITGQSPYSSNSAISMNTEDYNVSKRIGGLLTASAWCVVDMRNDFAPADKTALLILSFFPILTTGLLSPGASGPFSLLPWDTNLNKSKNVFWCLKWAPVGYASIYVASQKFAAGPRGNPVGCGILSFLGATVLATGIWKGVQETQAGTGSAANWFLNIAPPLVTMAKPLRFAAPPLGTAALLAIDLVGDTGGGAISYKQA